MELDVRKSPLMINGSRCHEVLQFEGERASIVAYTKQGYDGDKPKPLLKDLENLGFTVPTAHLVTHAKARLFKKQWLQW